MYCTDRTGLGFGPAIIAAAPVVAKPIGTVVGGIISAIGGLFGGGVSAAERAQHMANLQTLYNQALAGDQVALCRLQAAGGLAGSSATCGGTTYGRFGDSQLRAEAARLYYQVTQGGRPVAVMGAGGIGTGTLIAIGAAVLLVPLVLRRRRR